MNPLIRLGAAEAVALVHGGTVSARALTEAYLERIAEREPAIRAFAHLDPDRARAEAAACDAAGGRGALAGLPVGVKDICDTRDMPTGHGFAPYADNRPTEDAEIVARVRAAGGTVPGKTATTEFAGPAPAPTRNPRDERCSPGGSSAGSAAAVADFMLPVAIGTQTAGSVIRPAAYCGIVGIKPSHGLVPLAGVRRCAPEFDTVGTFGRSVRDAALLLSVLAGDPPLALDGKHAFAPRIGLCRPPEWDAAEPAMQQALEAAAVLFSRRGAATVEIVLPPDFRDAVQAQSTVMTAETARTTPETTDERRAYVSPQMRAITDGAAAILANDEALARVRLDRQRSAAAVLFAEVDVLLCPSAIGEAPEGLGHTGDPLFNRVWTAMRTPCITLPFRRGPRGMPLGIQVVGRRGADLRTIAAAMWMERVIARDRD